MDKDTKEKETTQEPEEKNEEPRAVPPSDVQESDKGDNSLDQALKQQQEINAQLLSTIEKLTEKVEKISKNKDNEDKIKALNDRINEISEVIPSSRTKAKPLGYYDFDRASNTYKNEEYGNLMKQCEKIWDQFGIN